MSYVKIRRHQHTRVHTHTDIYIYVYSILRNGRAIVACNRVGSGFAGGGEAIQG